MKKLQVLAMCAIVGVMLTNPMNAKAAYQIGEDGCSLVPQTPTGAVSMDNSFGEKETYDAKGNVKTYVTASGCVSTYQYDAKGNAESLNKVRADGSSNGNTIFVRDAQGRVMKEIDEEGTEWYLYEYNETQMERRSAVFGVSWERWTYDGANRVVSYETLNRTYTYGYNEKGEVSAIKEIAPDKYVCDYEFTYDDKGNVISEHQYDTHGFNKTYQYINDYDGKGRLTAVTEPDKNMITWYHY